MYITINKSANKKEIFRKRKSNEQRGRRNKKCRKKRIPVKMILLYAKRESESKKDYCTRCFHGGGSDVDDEKSLHKLGCFHLNEIVEYFCCRFGNKRFK